MKKLSILPKKRQSKQIEPSASTETNLESSVSVQEKAPLCLLHRTCRSINLTRFKQAYCNNDLTALIIEGTPTDDQLVEAWSEIIFEYGSLFKSEESNYLFELSQRIETLRCIITETDMAVYYLKELYRIKGETDQEVVDQLSFLGYPGEFDLENPERYLQDINRCISLCKTSVFDLEELIKEEERLQKTSKGKKQTEEDFDTNILMLSKYQHYPLDEEITSAYKFAKIFNNYLAEMNIRHKKTGDDGE